MAVAKADQELAWGQLHTFFDNQLSNGALADSISDLNVTKFCMKPPVYGWAIRQLVDIYGWDNAMPHVEKLYEPMIRLTNFWYKFRDRDGNMRSHYLHGNDSGWDNATAFDDGTPLEGADLSAYLVLQMEMLSEMAAKLGKLKEAEEWEKKSKKQLDVLLTSMVKNDHFVNYISASGELAPTRSLINYIPLILGDRLPEKIRKKLITDLQPGGDYLTDYGLASEAITSDKYEANGYWRGPIWAPPNYQIFYGLEQAGHKELAAIIAERYCGTYVKNPTFNENNNALTGEGLQAPGVTWTAAAFILMASWLADNSSLTR